MGRAKYYEIKGDFEKALDNLNEVTVIYAWFLPAVTEKARIVIKSGDWDQGVELARKVLEQDSFDIESLRILVLEVRRLAARSVIMQSSCKFCWFCCAQLLCRQSRPPQAVPTLTDLIDSLDRHEPKNASLCHRISQSFARLCSRSKQVLELTLALVERARVLEPENSVYVTEYGYQQALLGDFGSAAESYRQASKLDESNVAALAGMIYCQIAEGQFDDAEQQLDLFRMIQESIGRTSELAFLDALLAWCAA
jgi:tetratricopeptide repeat protein 21B